MKRLNVILVIGCLLGAVWAEERPWTTRESLAVVEKGGENAANELLQSIDSGDINALRNGIHKALAQGHWKIVAALLRYTSVPARQEAAISLESIKTPSVARKLLEGLDFLDIPAMGGDETENERKETRRIYEKSLSVITGINISENWTDAQRRRAFAAWIAQRETLPNKPERPITQHSTSAEEMTNGTGTPVQTTISPPSLVSTPAAGRNTRMLWCIIGIFVITLLTVLLRRYRR